MTSYFLTFKQVFDRVLLGWDSVQTEFCSAFVTLLGQSVRTGFCSDKILLGRCHSAWAECSDGIMFGHNSARVECRDGILFGQNSARPLSLCSGRVFGRDSARPLSLCWGRVFGWDSAWARFYSATVTLYAQSVRTRSCLGRILFGHGHSVRAECSDTILLGQDSVRPRSLCTGRVFGHDYTRAGFCSATVTLYGQSVRTRSCSGRILFGHYLGSLHDLIREYPLPEGWYARLPGLQEPANYGTKFETGIYEEQVKSGYRLPLHPFALRFFEHYRMAPGQLVPNGWRKLAGLIYLVQTSGYKPDPTDFMRVFFEICFVKGVANCPGWNYIHSRQRLLKGGPKSNKGWHFRYFFIGRLDKGELPFDRDWNPFCKDFKNPGKPTPNNLTKHILNEPLSEEQLEWAKIIPPKPILAGLLIPSPPPTIPSMSSAETVPLEMASGSGKFPKGGFLGILQKAKGKQKEKQPSAELPPVPKRSRVIPPERSPRILEQVSIDDDPIFRPRWTLRHDDLGMPDSQVSEQHLLYGILPRDKEVFQTQTHETFAYSFAQAVYTMYASGSEMLSHFEMARQVAAYEAQQKREAIKEAQEASHRAEELSKRGDQGIRDFLDINEWLKKRTEDGLEIYDLGFTKANEMFVECFLDIPLDDFVLPAVISPSGETVLPSEAGDAAASHPPGEECSAITLFAQNVFGYIDHSVQAECSPITLFGRNVFSYIDHSVWAECSAITLFRQNVFGYIAHSVWAECSAITLYGQNVLAKLITVFRQSVRPSLCSDIMAFILPGGLLFTVNANLDVGRRPRRNAVYFTDSSKLSISKNRHDDVKVSNGGHD
ncbi:hypothetical protein RJ639_040453 [Escallonia herrerae]|uniref:Transposase (putative) gypsy type domain-containing protein n=1 Tax=Escallonia herrerae TaxID=1293975 RepID=A0AA88WGI3_9ASTE|nr:hypothetical protein RJ639_040453 [Escallonia herrerae]